MIDYVCPARPVSLEFDSEINDFYFQQYPTTPITAVAFVLGYNQIYAVAKNDFGGAKYVQIMFADNPMLVGAFAIAAIIAIVGALLFVQLTIMLVKSLKRQYDKFLIGQKQQAITRNHAKL